MKKKRQKREREREFIIQELDNIQLSKKKELDNRH